MSDYIWIIGPIGAGLSIIGLIVCCIVGCIRKNKMQTTISTQAFSKNNTYIATAQATPIGVPFNDGFNPAMNMMNTSNMGMLNSPMPITTPYDPLNPINDNISSGIQQSLMKNF
jgi:hypothetical protein